MLDATAVKTSAPANVGELVGNTPHHHMLEKIVDFLENCTQNTDRAFFRNIAAYHMGVCAATMRTEVSSPILMKPMVVNTYNIALGTSGVGKGYSMHIMENMVMTGFRRRFTETTMPHMAEHNMNKLASQRAGRKGGDATEEDELETLQRQYRKLGNYQFVFDGGHESAIKDLRNRLLLADCGALNYQVDEIGSNLDKSADSMKVYLELYDNGEIKNKLLKNSTDNERFEELYGSTPSNAMLFGAPDEIFAGGSKEDMFFNFLRIGFARRSLFALALVRETETEETIEEMYARLERSVKHFSNTPLMDHFTRLADVDKVGWKVHMPEETGKLHLAYQRINGQRAKVLKAKVGDNIAGVEMEHRQSVALKVAGIFAFVDETSTMHPDHYRAAVKLVEESGEALDKILFREKPYQRLAKYIAKAEGQVSCADLEANLPFFPTSSGKQKDMLTLAIAYGYSNNIIIKKHFRDLVEYYTGDSLQEVDMSALTMTYSAHYSDGYKFVKAPFDKLNQLAKGATKSGQTLHWCNHCFTDDHRNKANIIKGFDMVVLDVDGGTRLETVHEILKDFHFMTHTTKRHTDQAHRFRVVLPLNYQLKLDRDEYMQFIQNIYDWLPFEVDGGGTQPERKWETNPNAKVFFNPNKEAKQFDVLPFIPSTTRNQEHVKQQQALKDMGSLERWFAQHWGEGNRNNLMIRFAMCLVDDGQSYSEVEQRVLAFNKSLPSSLSVDELQNTVLKSVAAKMSTTP